MNDHRLMVVEPEFASTFKVAAREGNTLSPVIRQAWDSGTLRTMTRNRPLRAADAHISIIGHITREELERHLNATEVANGLANRILWVRVRRSKLLPEGGGTPDQREYDRCVLAIKGALAHARRCGRVDRDGEARDLWHREYERLSTGEPGMVGSLLARSEAHVLRLSLLYALADMSATVKLPHLEAALALWDYADRSVRSLYGHRTGNPDADTIIRRLADGTASRTEISGLFARHADRNRLERALRHLEQKHLITRTTRPTTGRPIEQWELTSPNSLVSQSQWPIPPDDKAYHGTLGDIVRLLDPHTEADPVAVLSQLLVAFGNAIGRTPYAQVEADPHHTNEFVVLVGDTAKARKGTSWGWPRRIISEADPGWAARIMGGLSSGEGLIAQVSERETSETSEEGRST